MRQTEIHLQKVNPWDTVLQMSVYILTVKVIEPHVSTVASQHRHPSICILLLFPSCGSPRCWLVSLSELAVIPGTGNVYLSCLVYLWLCYSVTGLVLPDVQVPGDLALHFFQKCVWRMLFSRDTPGCAVLDKCFVGQHVANSRSHNLNNFTMEVFSDEGHERGMC